MRKIVVRHWNPQVDDEELEPGETIRFVTGDKYDDFIDVSFDRNRLDRGILIRAGGPMKILPEVSNCVGITLDK